MKILTWFICCFLTVFMGYSQPPNTTQVGHWGYGTNYAVALNGGFAYIGSGSVFVILDISDPNNPIFIGDLFLSDKIYDVEIAGDYAYVANDIEDFRIINISDPENPWLVSSTNVNGQIQDILLVDNLAYLSCRYGDVVILDISNPWNPTKNYTYFTSGINNEIDIVGDYIYLLSGDRFSILNASDPELIVEQGFLTLSGDDVVVSGNYAYLAMGNGVNIINVSDPSNPFEEYYYQTTHKVEGITLIDNYIWVYTKMEWWPGLSVLNISNPIEPIEIEGLFLDHFIWDIKGGNGLVLLAGIEKGLKIVKNEDPETIYLAGNYDTPDKMVDIDIEGDFIFLANGYDGMRVLDCSLPEAPVQMFHYQSDGFIKLVAVKDNIVCIHQEDFGFRIFNVSNPSIPLEISSCETIKIARDLIVLNNYVIISNAEGLHFFNISDPINIEYQEVYSLSDPNRMTAYGNFIYCCNGESGIAVIDFNDMDNPHQVDFFNAGCEVSDVSVNEEYTCLALNDNGLYVLNNNDPSLLTLLGMLDPLQDVNRVYLSGDFVYSVSQQYGMYFYNVSDPSLPYSAGHYWVEDPLLELVFKDYFVFMMYEENGIEVIRNDLLSQVVERTSISTQILDVYCFPKPASSVVNLSIGLPERAEVSISIYQSSGNLVNTLDLGIWPAGNQIININVSELLPGIYPISIHVTPQHVHNKRVGYDKLVIR